jgi:hypothetical protein
MLLVAVWSTSIFGEVMNLEVPLPAACCALTYAVDGPVLAPASQLMKLISICTLRGSRAAMAASSVGVAIVGRASISARYFIMCKLAKQFRWNWD